MQVSCTRSSLLITGLRRLSVACPRVVRRRTVVGGARAVSGRPAGSSAGRSAGRPAGRPGGARVVSGAEKKNNLIEAAPFGRFDQM